MACQSFQENAIKIVVIGDTQVGKSCLLLRYAKDDVNLEYTPTIFDSYSSIIEGKERNFQLLLIDTSGHENYDRFRPVSYQNAEIVFICFSLVKRKSFENVSLKWLPELKIHAQQPLIFLIGTKSDLKLNKKKTTCPFTDIISQEEINNITEKVEGKYFECSAYDNKNINTLFQTAIQRAVQIKMNKIRKKRFKCRKRRCLIL